jgi:hypothetical protein
MLGEIGAGELRGDIGDSLEVPVRVRTLAVIDDFGLDLTFPNLLVRYDTTTVGAHTQGFDLFGGDLQSGNTTVRIGGIEAGEDTISSEAFAEIAIVHFTVIAAGCDAFALGPLYDDLFGYSECSAGSPAGAGGGVRGPVGGLSLSARPNPFVREVSLESVLAEAADVWIRIYDVRGNGVITLADGERADAGTLRRSWDGFDLHGARVPSGVYFVRLSTGTGATETKLLRLR